MVALAAAGFIVVWLFEGQPTALRLLPTLLIFLALQQGDVYVHLGLNWRPSDGLFREQLGIPTMLTLVRGVMADLLLAHLLSGVIPLVGFTLSVYLIGVATDIADGQIAWRTHWQSRLGGNLDGEADLFLSVSATLCALLAGVLPAWFAATILLRFAAPVIGALLSYFVAIRQVDFSHTAWGRSAGIAQSIVLITVLAPKVLVYLLAPIYLPLLLVTCALLLLAPVMEVRKNLRCWRWQKQKEV
jgi:phosphatidylglycerophosphate synthase